MKIEHLPPGDILRCLPSIVDAQQRLRLDVQVHCHDVMVNALHRLRGECMAFDPAHLSPQLVASIFADAWSIIDQLDIVRQIINSTLGPNGPVTSALLAEAGNARTMRNAMDHISQRIPNIAGRTGKSETLFGSLTFVKCAGAVLSSATVGRDIEAQFVAIARGTVPGYEAGTSGTFSTYDVTQPISNLRLNAADCSVRLDLVCALFTDVIEGLSESVGASIDQQIPQFVLETGTSEVQARAPTPVVVAIQHSIRFPYGPEQ